MLSVRKVCLENGCNIIVRAARKNARTKQGKIDADAAREAGRQNRDDDEAVTFCRFIYRCTSRNNSRYNSRRIFRNIRRRQVQE
jgi:hypothetical protein